MQQGQAQASVTGFDFYIDHIKFETGKIYAIADRMRKGVSSLLLNDIAGSIDNSEFESSGEIFYPSYDRKGIPTLFCSTMPFEKPASPDETLSLAETLNSDETLNSSCYFNQTSKFAPELFSSTTPFKVPAKNLYEQLTYRLPQDYLEKNSTYIINRARELFAEFGYNFTDHQAKLPYRWDGLGLSLDNTKMIEKSVKPFPDRPPCLDTVLAPEEEKTLSMLVSTILYKEYLNKPVLLLLDETLTILDNDTHKLHVISQLNQVFSDSIIISGDNHIFLTKSNKKVNTARYDECIDLDRYISTQDGNHEAYADPDATPSGNLSEGYVSSLSGEGSSIEDLQEAVEYA